MASPQSRFADRAAADLPGYPLLRSQQNEDWEHSFTRAGLGPLSGYGITFGISLELMTAVRAPAGVGMAPPLLFSQEIEAGALSQPLPSGFPPAPAG